MIHSAEYVLSDHPFVIRRTVRWSDCDPAGVVFTGKFFEYVLSAEALFKDYITGRNGNLLSDLYNVDTPCRGMSIDFIKTLWPDDVIEIECAVGEIRTRSFDFIFRARSRQGDLVFDARLSPICVRTDERVATTIPESLRAMLLLHVAGSTAAQREQV